MSIINAFFLGPWLPVFYILYGIFFRKAKIERVVISIVLVVILFLNWSYVGRIQNVHIVGISILACYLFPPRISSGKTILWIAFFLTFALLVRKLFFIDGPIRSFLFFGPNTDSALLIIALLNLLVSGRKLHAAYFLIISSFIVLATQSRAAFILLLPGFFVFLQYNKSWMISIIKERYQIVIQLFVYISSLVAVFSLNRLMNLIYNSFGNEENRLTFTSAASDRDRMEAFDAAYSAFLADYKSVTFGTDILPAVTGASNSIHSEIFSFMFGGGLIIFFLFSAVMVIYIFVARCKFSIVILTCYFAASGFSNSLMSFPFIFMIYIVLRVGCSGNLFRAMPTPPRSKVLA